MVKILKIVNVHYSMAFIEDLQKYFGQQDISSRRHCRLRNTTNFFFVLPKYDVIATHKLINRCISEHAGLAVRERFKQ